MKSTAPTDVIKDQTRKESQFVHRRPSESSLDHSPAFVEPKHTVDKLVGRLEFARYALPYIQLARVDHWFKNVFVLFGAAFACLHDPLVFKVESVPRLVLALLATCVAASGNYVLNELQDAPYDRCHPTKRYRPIPSGRASEIVAYFQWILFSIIAVVLAAQVNALFSYTIILLLIMGLVYNVAPLRTKDVPILDVLSESFNNPIRCSLGWFALVSTSIPPVVLLLACWLIGAVFMATKRLAEYRSINDRSIAVRYRKSFRFYDETRMVVALTFYIALFSMCCGVFIVSYRLELVLMMPLIAGFTTYYFKVSLKEGSVVQSPEKLYREKGLVLYAGLCVIAFVLLLFTDLPAVHEYLSLEPPNVGRLWSF